MTKGRKNPICTKCKEQGRLEVWGDKAYGLRYIISCGCGQLSLPLPLPGERQGGKKEAWAYWKFKKTEEVQNQANKWRRLAVSKRRLMRRSVIILRQWKKEDEERGYRIYAIKCS